MILSGHRSSAAVAAALDRARVMSPFLATLAARDPALVEAIVAGEPVAILGDDLALADTARDLRIARRRLALAVALYDLAGVYDLTAVTAALSDFADLALDRAIRAAMLERTPEATPAGFIALALGKQGSRELNYSSDIDPILLYDPATLPRRARDEPEEAAVRIAKRAVELLQRRDADGYVLRVDLRLRPSSEITPLAIPVEGAIGYYESQALPWERAAFIRARACAGDVALGERFLEAIRPFVWRRSLDFGAIGEITSLTQRIRDHHAQGQAFGPGYDLKRGRGGIREVEFFAQGLQLIHGGRDPSLRAPATRDALAALASAGHVDQGEAEALRRAYERLRTVEHRVQMIDDRQTHTLPAGESLDRVARLDGLASGDALLADLRPHVESTAAIYDRLAPPAADALSTDHARLIAQLAAMGFAEAEGAARLVEQWRSGRYPALRSPAALAALEAVLPPMLRALADAPDPQRALAGFDRLAERLPTAINAFRLLEARPPLTGLLAAILAQAPTLAEELARRPALLDGLIDASAFAPTPPAALLAADLRAGDAADYQERLEHVRRVVGEKRFALGAQIVAGARDPLEVAQGYAQVAEAAVEVLAEAATDEFARAHGRVPDSELVILALGRFGGGAMTHASDLDLIYLFTGDFRAESDGAKPLGATLYYTRLASRVTAALSVPTAAGPLYPVDTRLRPSGTQGPMVVGLDSFARYQRQEAWTWERMALTRARPVFGSRDARAAVEAIVADALHSDTGRDIPADARSMRAEMAAHKPPQGPLDAKLLPGGLVDLEFAVHVRQLVHRAGFDADLGRAIDVLAGEGLLPRAARPAHDLLTRLLVTARLVAPDLAIPAESTCDLIARALGEPDWASALAAFASARQDVIALEETK
jgi:glutamate-ammonia-ligase adenylyltransferase